MRNLIIDIGNTRIKGGVFENGKLISEYYWKDIHEVEKVYLEKGIAHVLVSSVKEKQNEFRDILDFPFMYFDKNTPLPILNLYSTPDTLGSDRLAGVVGGLSLVGKGPILSIDLGTCITYDLLSADLEYLGGAISPGLEMRASAMALQTRNLPKVDLVGGESVSDIGNSTIRAIQAGIYYGVKGEIAEFINSYSEKHENLTVFLCGGDANFFEKLTKDHIFVIPNLVLHGLNRILTYNVDKN
ncbi:type III pantothenate kinase [Anditalea andensis]|uniref:Type III pantothenate kinase n=1 Tax=Anditalea andensis TaxID=1048983 RepID=A0A074KZZ1_9BACT|nr:type III pantothenate kinase [Anditalea andensis]KEO73163.1 Baf family transcriptional acitvator [Anditalea andensis]